MLDAEVEVPEGQSPFLYDSALVDVLHRLGFSPEEIGKLESWWWFTAPSQVTPDDLASRLMAILPWETKEEAEKRRSLGRMELPPQDIGKLRRRGK